MVYEFRDVVKIHMIAYPQDVANIVKMKSKRAVLISMAHLHSSMIERALLSEPPAILVEDQVHTDYTI